MCFVLSLFSLRIDEVTVQIGDVGGTPGSSQKLCRLSVRMKQLGRFSVDSIEDELAPAVSRSGR